MAPIDISKRYDLYCSHGTEQQIYETVRIVGIRTFSSETGFGSALIGGYWSVLLEHRQCSVPTTTEDLVLSSLLAQFDGSR